MRAISTHELTRQTMPRSETEKLWVYNGLDCCVTSEVLDAIKPQLDNQTRATYEFSKSLQGPVLEMNLRGILVDKRARLNLIRDIERDVKTMEHNLYRLLKEGVGKAINWRSPDQLATLLYEVMGLPPVKIRRGKGEYTVTVNRDALEQLQRHFYAQPIIGHILGLRDLQKKLGVLYTDIDSDGRMRTSYNIAGTTTGRFSSAFNDFGTGTNLQNIEERLRRIFIADRGFKFAYVDLEQAESRLVGAIEWNLFNDGTYLDACESGDLHTAVARLAWPYLPWTGDIRTDKYVAERPFYRQHSYRHMAKVLGHGTNYNGKPYTMAKHTHLDSGVIRNFQQRYFAAFPSHPRWHARVASDLAQYGHLTTLTGRRRWFFGRRDEDATIREAIAFNPQGSVGDILNQGMLQVWRAGICQLVLQIHDAILVQYPEEREDEIVPQVLEAIRVEVPLHNGRSLTIPAEAMTGWNWAKQVVNDQKEVVDNHEGLRAYHGNDSRRRPEAPSISELDYLLSRVYGTPPVPGNLPQMDGHQLDLFGP